MVVVNQVMVEVFNAIDAHQRRNLGGTQTSSVADPTAQFQTAVPSTTTAPPPAMTSQATGGGPTSSPLLFFVALGFGVVFTNLWIIVGVKYCFRYNARNRAIRNGEDVDNIGLEAVPRPHRRRREKKLMTMDEVNERFPLTKYKNWVASRALEGLPTSGGVTAPSSRAASLREADGVMPSSPVDTKHSINTRPATANSDRDAVETTPVKVGERKSMEAKVVEKENAPKPATDEHNKLEEVRTTASTVDRHPTVTSEIDDDDEDDHIHTAVPPELLINPGDSCAICIDVLEDDDDIRGLTCGHVFHAGCLDPWLTSRRACCPLCKADYYIPKPRPEGEAADPERTGRRRESRMSMPMPQPPPSAHRGFFTLRSTHMYNGGQYSHDQGRGNARRARRQQAAEPQANAATNATPTPENTDASAPRRWRPSNPFSSMALPTVRFPGRRQPTESNTSTVNNPSPSQLEAGVVR